MDWSLQETAHCHPATDCHWHHSWGPAAKTVSSTCGRLGSPQHGELQPHCHLSALGDLIPRLCYCYHSLLPRLTIKNVADLVHLCMVSCCLAATSLLDLSLYWPGLEFTFKDLLPTLSVQHGDCQHRVWQLVSCYITAPSLLDFLSLLARFKVYLWGFAAKTDSSKCGRPGFTFVQWVLHHWHCYLSTISLSLLARFKVYVLRICCQHSQVSIDTVGAEWVRLGPPQHDELLRHCHLSAGYLIACVQWSSVTVIEICSRGVLGGITADVFSTWYLCQ